MKNLLTRHPSISCLLPVLVWAALLAGCARQQEAAAPAPPEVTVARPVQQDVMLYRNFTGQTDSVNEVEVRARVQGYLESMHFRPASYVEEGDLLFIIEQEQYQANLSSARAALESASAELERAEADLMRGEQALKTNAISEAEVSRMRAERDKAAAGVQSASAALTQAKLDLSYTEIRSPIRGRVGRNLVDVGNLVGAGEATLLTTVVAIDPLYVYFDVPARVILEVLDERKSDFKKEPSLDFSIGRETDTGYPFTGTLDFIENIVDPNTSTIQVRGVVSNAEGRLYPGLYARVRVPSGTHENAVLVRERSIGTDLAGKYVLVIGEENVVEQRYVQLGQLEGDMRIILDGITPNDTYIVTGLQRARPGLPVTPIMEEREPEESPAVGEQAASQPGAATEAAEKGDG